MTQTKDQIALQLADAGYIADEGLATALLLTGMLGRPLLLEGEAGVGKTEVAKALARLENTDLIRLQCYEGLDRSDAIYEWNYQRQLLAIKRGKDLATVQKLSRKRFSPRNIFWNAPFLRPSERTCRRFC